jgi:alkanesulfonate monooxygenase SsuD/methylene tetrahydromethanopterin reductase-like flavin-dependent oxidoreductase (luciferase family)
VEPSDAPPAAVSFGLAVPHLLCGFDPSGAAVDVDLDRWASILNAPAVDSLWVLDQPTGRMATPDPMSLLGFVAAMTSEPRLGIAVLIGTARGPVATAKAIATLDWLSRGRIEVGFGLGDARTYGAFGVDRHEGGGSGAILDELLSLVDELWTGQPVHHEGRTWKFAGEAVNPRPLQQPPPVWIGGESDAAYRRAIRRGGRWIGAGRSTSADFARNARRLRELHGEADVPGELTVAKRVYVALDSTRDTAERQVRGWFDRFYGMPDWGPRCSVFGSADDVRVGIDELVAAGAGTLLLHPLSDDPDMYEHLTKEVITR